MNFKQATDALLVSVTLEDLAQTMGVSVQTIRQARADEGSTAYRTPPEGWGPAVQRLARRQAERLLRLADKI